MLCFGKQHSIFCSLKIITAKFSPYLFPQIPPCFNWLSRFDIISHAERPSIESLRNHWSFQDRPGLFWDPGDAGLPLIRLQAECRFCWHRSPNISVNHEGQSEHSILSRVVTRVSKRAILPLNSRWGISGLPYGKIVQTIIIFVGKCRTHLQIHTFRFWIEVKITTSNLQRQGAQIKTDISKPDH